MRDISVTTLQGSEDAMIERLIDRQFSYFEYPE